MGLTGAGHLCFWIVLPCAGKGPRDQESRAAESAGNSSALREGRVYLGTTWRNYAETAAVDPYADGPQVELLRGFAGEMYQFRRAGPRQDQMQISVSCWSHRRHPDWCCPGKCWKAQSIQDHCCKEGVSADGPVTAFHHLTPHLMPHELAHFYNLFPGPVIDEEAFKSTQLRFRVGWNPPGAICPSRTLSDGSLILWPLVALLVASTSMSGTFLNIGAGTCEPPDPLYQLLSSPEGRGFVGLAVESNRDRLDRCMEVMSRMPGRVLPVLLTIDPTIAAEQLLPHLMLIFGHSPRPWRLDLLVVDVDGVDCLIIEEVLQIVRPKVIQLEIVAHIPPPFRFSLQWHADHSHAWDKAYDIGAFTPTAGCSLSYALHKFRPFGYDLLQLTMHDAVFVHSSIAPVIEEYLQVQLPQDEFQCYRNSTLWLQMPASYIREWLFAKHPSAVIASIWSNLSSLNEEMGRESLPFTLDF